MSKVRNRAIAARFRETQAHMSTAEGKKISGREIDRRSGTAEGHYELAMKALEAGKTITLDVFLDLATGMKVDPGWLLTGSGSGQRLADLPEWPEQEKLARARYQTVPDFAIWQVGKFTMPHAPTIDAALIANLARAWFEAAGDDLRSAVEGEFVRSRSAKK